jgi:hypothetical protein
VNPATSSELRNCGLCGVSEKEHRNLYGTGLGFFEFSFAPDTGNPIRGKVRMCRPCTHEQLPRRLLQAAGVPEEALSPEVWF